jgi:hypothetical protein
MQENFILRDSVICDYSDRLLGRCAGQPLAARPEGSSRRGCGAGRALDGPLGAEENGTLESARPL